MSFRLRNFKRKGNNNWNFSCPFCGDSKTDTSKARGYVFPSKGKLRYYCHNCAVPGIDIPKLLKHEDQGLYDEYIKEKLISTGSLRKKTDVELFADKMKTPTFVKATPLNKLKKISQLAVDSPVKAYIQKRQIPPEYHYKLFYCSKFMTWVNEFEPNKFENVEYDEPRLIIPLIDEEGNLFGVQGRSFKKDASLRYITIMFDETKPKLYGMDSIDKRLHISVVEGPIDSMFLPNALAAAGSDLTSNLSYITDDPKKFTIIYDNEPRNKEIISKIEKAINKGYPVCIWPDIIAQKDINDMIIKGGVTKDKVVDIIAENTYTDLEAKLKLQQWKKI